MSERIARLRAHQSNIDRYEGLLRSTLSAIELRFVEQRLSEERLALAMLQYEPKQFIEGRWSFRFAAIARDRSPASSTKSRRWVEISDGLLFVTNQKVRTRMSLKL